MPVIGPERTLNLGLIRKGDLQIAFVTLERETNNLLLSLNYIRLSADIPRLMTLSALVATNLAAIRNGRRQIMRGKDFHGGRAYAADAPDKRRYGPSLVIAWIKLQLSRLSPSASSVLSRPSRRMGDGFSLLGLDQRHAQLRQLDTDVFPMPHRRRGGAKSVGPGIARE